MRRVLGSFLPALLLVAAPVTLLGAACGGAGDSGTAADDPASSTPTGPASGSPTPGPGLDTGAGYDVVDILTATAAGGTVDPAAVPLDDDAARRAFFAQFTTGALADQAQGAIERAATVPGERLYAAVVAIGCDAPTRVEVVSDQSGVSITGVPVAHPRPECLAPMTSVALVQVGATGAQSGGDVPSAS